MKKIFNYFKTLIYGIIPAIAGMGIAINIYYVIRNIQHISAGSGWAVVYYFALGATELFLAITLLYELGSLNILAGNWKKHLKNNASESADTSISGNGNETSDITTNDLGEPDSNKQETKKRSKKK